jgi:hypothetical protein
MIEEAGNGGADLYRFRDRLIGHTRSSTPAAKPSRPIRWRNS